MLIVNADDVGASPTATDFALRAYAAGALSSCTAMVWMPDTGRAATLVREHGLATGLHLNLTLPFADDSVPRPVRDRQLRLVGRFQIESWRDEDDAPIPRQLLRDAISDQIEEFRERFGEPTHLDGHHHVHVHAAVIDALGAELPIRPILREADSLDRRPSRREREIRRRFRGVELAIAFEHLHPALGGIGLAPLERSRVQPVEVMTHPQLQPQLDALLSHEWLTALAGLPLGSYREI